MVYRDFQQHYRNIIDEGGTTIVHGERELIAAVLQYLKQPELKRAERAATTRKMLTYTDGGSAARLLDVLKGMA